MSVHPAGIRRRSMLTAAPLPFLATMPQARAEADGADHHEGGQVIAFITDVHVNAEASPDNTARARVTAQALVDLDPDLVIHGGDLTQFGSATEFRTWLDMFPASFLERVHHVPGNHETHWASDNYEAYRAEIGPLWHSIDLDDLHIAFINSSIQAQGLADYYSEQLEWLRDDLGKAKGRPTLVVGHHIMALSPNYLRHGDEVLDLLTEYGVAAYLCGHIHSERDNVVNGLTELVGLFNGGIPGYYLLTRDTDDDHDVLTTERVDLEDPADPDAQPGRRSLPDIDLAPSDRNRLRPEAATASVHGDGLKVSVELGADVEVKKVEAAVMGPVIMGGNVEDYTEMTSDGATWSATLDLDEAPAGQNRAFVQVTGTPVTDHIGGDLWHTTIPFETEGFAPTWTSELAGSVSAALVQDDDLVIAAGTTGDVVALRDEGTSADTVWSTHIGGVHDDPATLSDEHRMFLPSSDHHVHALDTTTGEQLWRTDLGAPVMSHLATAEVDDETVVLAVAVDHLHCLRAEDGSSLWDRRLESISSGPAVCDGDRLFLGLGEGRNWAFDARTGEPVWNIEQAEGYDDAYRRRRFSPWAAKRLLLPGDAVLVNAKDTMSAVRRETGETIWRREGPFGVCPAPRMWHDQILAVSDKGTVMVLDPATGDSEWELDTINYMKNADFLLRGSDMILTGAGGLVASVDLDDRSSRILGQILPDYVLSSPLLSADGSRYIVATMGGDVRSYPLP
jgi:outer membrane protein assembly factor BamB/3',5'-cyclic AMP phosphodiesterase CpdA